VRDRLSQAAQVTSEDAAVARRFQAEWKATFDRLFQAAQLLVLPTVPFFPPPVSNGGKEPHTRLTAPINLAGLPALALPVPAPGSRLPASLQLIGPAGSEELILATGAVLEAAAGYRRP
jgi:amidase